VTAETPLPGQTPFCRSFSPRTNPIANGFALRFQQFADKPLEFFDCWHVQCNSKDCLPPMALERAAEKNK